MTSRKFEISAAFAPALDTPDHIALAEELGFARAWCYDAPAVWADVWMTLARAADRTKRIELGTAVLVPNYRHVMVTAAAIATLAGQAPGRVAVGIGVGHGNKIMGDRAMSWKETEHYITTLRRLLAGEAVAMDDAKLGQMLHNEGFVARRPVDVPILLAAQGPKSLEIAHRIGDGVIRSATPAAGFDWSSVVLFGTVLPDDGSIDAARVMDAAGFAAAVPYHATYSADWREGGIFKQLPQAETWAAALEKHVPERRHLVAWARHMVGMTEEDKLVLTPELVRMLTFSGTAQELRARLDALKSAGATEVIYQPGGSDIPGELRRFAKMAGL